MTERTQELEMRAVWLGGPLLMLALGVLLLAAFAITAPFENLEPMVKWFLGFAGFVSLLVGVVWAVALSARHRRGAPGRGRQA